MGIAVVLIVMLMWILTACASQNRQVKFQYEYTTRCVLKVQGTEQQTGDEVAAGVRMEGDGCQVDRDTSAKQQE